MRQFQLHHQLCLLEAQETMQTKQKVLPDIQWKNYVILWFTTDCFYLLLFNCQPIPHPTHPTPLPHKQNHRLFQKSSFLTWGACKLCWIFMSVNIVLNHTTFVKPGYVNSHHCKALSTHKFTHFCRDLMSLRFTHFLPLLFWWMYIVNR